MGLPPGFPSRLCSPFSIQQLEDASKSTNLVLSPPPLLKPFRVSLGSWDKVVSYCGPQGAVGPTLCPRPPALSRAPSPGAGHLSTPARHQGIAHAIPSACWGLSSRPPSCSSFRSQLRKLPWPLTLTRSSILASHLLCTWPVTLTATCHFIFFIFAISTLAEYLRPSTLESDAQFTS